ncbi:hypothetical protein [Streptomyces sp. NBC_00183]|uniref:hypothetical protein n=1 Tax=Streptomyces sp. NBC_00183 TaxID=2903633 RepID=UPI00225BC457|nr:hypothetical protein [Streptomyces sp. NBC_00183]MCX5288728.1 hypothetical protein [Streptomyces sp. NBC_00183]
MASDAADGENYYEDSQSGTNSWSVPGSGNAMAYVHTRPDTKPGYLPQYNASAAVSGGSGGSGGSGDDDAHDVRSPCGVRWH